MVIRLLIWLVLFSSTSSGQPDSSKVFRVREVTVIEGRSGTDPLRLPAAASVVEIGSRSALRADALGAALEGIPGVAMSSRSGGTDLRLSIRGFGARGNGDRSNAATVRGIKVLLDGVPLTEPDGRTSLDLLSLVSAGQLEVVRTNATALFGNASGGILNVESPREFASPEFTFAATAGSYGYGKATGVFGAPLGTGSVFVSAGHMRLQGWRENSAVNAANIYSAVIFHPAGGTRLRATLGLTRHGFSIPGALTDAEYAADRSLPDPVYAIRRERRNNLVGLSSLQISHAIGEDNTLFVLATIGPKSLVRSERNTYRDFQRWTGGGGVLWRWAPDGGTFVTRTHPTLSLGIDFSLQDGNSLFYDLENGERGDSLRTNKAERAETAGLFSELTASPLDAWTVTASVRFDRQRYRSSIFPAGTILTTRMDELIFHHATPRLAVLAEIADRQSAYISFSGGLEVPAFNEVDPPPGIGSADLNPLLKPMVSTTLEAGYRNDGVSYGDWTASVSAAAFVISIRDEIVPFNGGAWYLSAGSSRRWGSEFSADLRSAHGIRAELAWSLIEGRYRTFNSSAGSFDGHAVPGLPASTLFGRIRYDVGFGVAVEGSLRRVGPMRVDDANTLRIPSSTTIDVAATWGFSVSGLRFDAQFAVRNLLDARFIAGAYINPATRPALPPFSSFAAPAYIEPGLPRNYIAGVSVRIPG